VPYNIRKQKCKQSSGKSGSYVLSYTDKKGKKHRACHTSRKKARGQIAAIEAEGIERNEDMKIKLAELRRIIREAIEEMKLQYSEEDDETKESFHEKAKKRDVTGDNKADFTDVMASRMMASGLSKEKAIKKAEKVVAKTKKKS
jgi:hypothetical protein